MIDRWLLEDGIGLRHNGPGPSKLKGPGAENAGFAGQSSPAEETAGPSGPENNINRSRVKVREGFGKYGPDGPAGPANRVPTTHTTNETNEKSPMRPEDLFALLWALYGLQLPAAQTAGAWWWAA